MHSDPISNQMFSDDFHRFVLQDQKIQNPNLNPNLEAPKPFDLNIGKPKKTKKDLEKEKQKKQREDKAA